MDRPKYGTSCVPGRLKPGRGTQRLKYGTSREIRDGWQAYVLLRLVQSQGGQPAVFIIFAVAYNCAHNVTVRTSTIEHRPNYFYYYLIAHQAIFLQIKRVHSANSRT